MPKGVYQYKFIVDNEWKFSNNFPFKNDGNGNINNVVDNSINQYLKVNNKFYTVLKNLLNFINQHE